MEGEEEQLKMGDYQTDQENPSGQVETEPPHLVHPAFIDLVDSTIPNILLSRHNNHKRKEGIMEYTKKISNLANDRIYPYIQETSTRNKKVKAIFANLRLVITSHGSSADVICPTTPTDESLQTHVFVTPVQHTLNNYWRITYAAPLGLSFMGNPKTVDDLATIFETDDYYDPVQLKWKIFINFHNTNLIFKTIAKLRRYKQITDLSQMGTKDVNYYDKGTEFDQGTTHVSDLDYLKLFSTPITHEELEKATLFLIDVVGKYKYENKKPQKPQKLQDPQDPQDPPQVDYARSETREINVSNANKFKEKALPMLDLLNNPDTFDMQLYGPGHPIYDMILSFSQSHPLGGKNPAINMHVSFFNIEKGERELNVFPNIDIPPLIIPILNERQYTPESGNLGIKLSLVLEITRRIIDLLNKEINSGVLYKNYHTFQQYLNVQKSSAFIAACRNNSIENSEYQPDSKEPHRVLHRLRTVEDIHESLAAYMRSYRSYINEVRQASAAANSGKRLRDDPSAVLGKKLREDEPPAGGRTRKNKKRKTRNPNRNNKSKRHRKSKRNHSMKSNCRRSRLRSRSRKHSFNSPS